MQRISRVLPSVGLAVLLAACGSTTAPTMSPSTAPSAAATDSPTPLSSIAPSIVVSPATSPVVDIDDEGSTTGGAANTSAPGAMVPPAPAADRLPGEPDSALTPGALNSAVTQSTIGVTVCVSGWTATVRPSSSYTNGLKVSQIAQYGYADTSLASYEEDHLIPLQLGGAPADPRNLWPQPYAMTLADGRSSGARVKDTFETSLKREVCGGSITLAQAQGQIGIHWVHAYYGIPFATFSFPPAAPTPRPTAAPTTAPAPGVTLSVRFVTLPDPAIPGSTASMTVKTSAGATCTAKVTWPSGTVSSAAGLKATPTADADGLASWTWNVGSTTKPGTAKASVTCTHGGSATGVASFAVQ